MNACQDYSHHVRNRHGIWKTMLAWHAKIQYPIQITLFILQFSTGTSESYTIDDAIEAIGFGKFQVKVSLISGFASVNISAIQWFISHKCVWSRTKSLCDAAIDIKSLPIECQRHIWWMAAKISVQLAKAICTLDLKYFSFSMPIYDHNSSFSFLFYSWRIPWKYKSSACLVLS